MWSAASTADRESDQLLARFGSGRLPLLGRLALALALTLLPGCRPLATTPAAPVPAPPVLAAAPAPVAPAPAPTPLPAPVPAEPPLLLPPQVQPEPAPPAPVAVRPQGPPPRPRVALVLGGGAARGFAHVGVIRELEKAKVPIDLVVGASAGSMIGAIYCSNRNVAYLERTALRLDKDDIFDFGLLSTVRGLGMAKGDKLEKFIRTHVRTARIENLKVPFAAVATDLNWGYEVVLDKGSVARAVRASSAIPGVFQPVSFQGKILVDGSVVDSIPIAVARAKGADLVVAVDITPYVGNTHITNLLGVTLQAADIMYARNVELTRKSADVLICPKVGDVNMLDFSQKRRCIRAGAEAARRAVPAIRRAIAAWVAARSRP